MIKIFVTFIGNILTYLMKVFPLMKDKSIEDIMVFNMVCIFILILCLTV